MEGTPQPLGGDRKGAGRAAGHAGRAERAALAVAARVRHPARRYRVEGKPGPLHKDRRHRLGSVHCHRGRSARSARDAARPVGERVVCVGRRLDAHRRARIIERAARGRYRAARRGRSGDGQLVLGFEAGGVRRGGSADRDRMRCRAAIAPGGKYVLLSRRNPLLLSRWQWCASPG